tara:strand:+ start:466 stop:1167 length:702 start_codon:yes stop_codon:yes gene_type:complete
MQATNKLLEKFELFRGLKSSELDYLCSRSRVERFARRAVVLQAGSQENKVCMLFEGRLQGVDFTIDGKEVGLYFVEPGDHCGELCVFDLGAQPEHVIAVNPAVVILFDAITVREIAVKNPDIMLELGTRLASRIRQMTSQRALLSIPSVTQRVCNQIWMLLQTEQTHKRDIAEINNLPTHMEIAIMLNLSRETVTRVFQQLQKRQIVSRDGTSRLIIHKSKMLKNMAEGSDKT